MRAVYESEEWKEKRVGGMGEVGWNRNQSLSSTKMYYEYIYIFDYIIGVVVLRNIIFSNLSN